jgi:hypothetical protein
MAAFEEKGSRFVVDLGSLKLPDDVDKDVEARIQQIVYNAIADLDLHGDSAINPFPPGLFGIVPPDYPAFPKIPLLAGDTGLILSSKEIEALPTGKSSIALAHNQIVQSVMEKPFHVIRRLPFKGGPLRASTIDILTAVAQASQAGGLDAGTNELIQLIEKIFPHLQKAQRSLPSQTRQLLFEITREFQDLENPHEIVSRLKLMQNSHMYEKYDGLSDGIVIAIQVIEAGRQTIYAAQHPFYDLVGMNEAVKIKSGIIVNRSALSNIAAAAAAGLLGGAAAGAVAGLAFPGAGTAAGAAAGALAGGVGGSVRAAVSEVWDWLF